MSDGRRDQPVRRAGKVVHLIAPALVGGAESVVRSLAVGQRSSDCLAGVLALVPERGVHPFVESLRALNVPVTEIAEGRRRYRAQTRAVAAALTASGAAIVHTHGYHANFVGFFAARRCGVVAVATFHGYTGGDVRNRVYEWVDRRLLARFNAVTCVSDSNKRHLQRVGVSIDRLHVVPNAIVPARGLSREAARRALGLDGSGPVIGWVGRLTHEKGADLFVQALQQVRIPGATAVLVGAGPESTKIAELATALPPGAPALKCVGERSDAAALQSAFDVLVISSRSEGLPIVMLEAMGAGTPIAAFAVGGIPEVLTNEAGWVVPAGNTKALGVAIEDAIRDREGANRKAGRAGVILAERHSLETWIDRTSEVYAMAQARRSQGL